MPIHQGLQAFIDSGMDSEMVAAGAVDETINMLRQHGVSSVDVARKVNNKLLPQFYLE
jgi:hypothetical protein